jgi:hypothetical protein
MPASLSYDIPHTIADTVIRALPAAGGRLFISGTATSIDLSNDPTMANAKNVLAAAGPFLAPGDFVAASFIRVNGGTGIVKISKS